MTAELISIARTVALEAAELAVRRRAEGVSVAATKSSTVDVVTAADREVEALIRARLAELRPADGFYGEESGSDPGTSGLSWVVDPIDGTVNYLYGIPHYAVSVAVVEGEPAAGARQALAGCVVNAGTGELFTASRGGGAFLGDRPLRIAAPPSLDQALVGTGFSYSAEHRRQQGLTVARLLPKVRDIRRAGAAALDLCAVAAGRLDAFYEGGLAPWDFAAGALVAVEARAQVEFVDDSGPLSFLAAGHPRLLEELVPVLRRG